MNRAEKRRQQKLDKKNRRSSSAGGQVVQNTLAIQAALSLATEHHDAGRLAEAEKLYRQVLKANSNHHVALHRLGVLAQQTGHPDAAIELIGKALTHKPDDIDARRNLANVFLDNGRPEEAVGQIQKALAIKPELANLHFSLANGLQQLGKFNEAIDSYRRALELKPDFSKAHNNLGNLLKELGKREEAIVSFSAATEIEPDFAKAFCNKGLTLKETGRLEEAIVNFKKALEVDPGFTQAALFLAEALYFHGRKNEAVQMLLTTLEKEPDSPQLSGFLIDILDSYIPEQVSQDVRVVAQKNFQSLKFPLLGSSKIKDESIALLFQQCQGILSAYDLPAHQPPTQKWSGKSLEVGCDRHMLIFDKFNIIPEFCFGCYKVSMDLPKVGDLFKLMIVFNNLVLPNDNPRKCMVEVRPDISGAYKGLIYCLDLDEAKEVLEIAQPAIAQYISSEISVSIKRGCSEYAIPYPEYSQIEGNTPTPMTYNEQWRETEKIADTTIVEHVYPASIDTFTHSSVTLRDAIVMKTWLAYASTIGDQSYLEIFDQQPVEELPMAPREPFNAGTD